MIVQLHAIVNREFLGDPSTIIGPQDSKASREIWSLSLSSDCSSSHFSSARADLLNYQETLVRMTV